jgi:hypothetical protein
MKRASAARVIIKPVKSLWQIAVYLSSYVYVKIPDVTLLNQASAPRIVYIYILLH